MKKAILVLISILFSVSAYAQLSAIGETFEKAKNKTTDLVSSKKSCPVYADTPVSEIVRKPWELEVGINFMYIPSNGGIQFRSDSFMIELNHNLSSVFGIYSRYDGMSFDKHKYQNQDEYVEWSSDWSIAAGFHFYFFPTIRLYGGYGTAAMKHDGTESKYDRFADWGVKVDFPLERWGYKMVLAYKVITVDTDESENNSPLDDWSYSGLSISVSFPFGYE